MRQHVTTLLIGILEKCFPERLHHLTKSIALKGKYFESYGSQSWSDKQIYFHQAIGLNYNASNMKINSYRSKEEIGKRRRNEARKTPDGEK